MPKLVRRPKHRSEVTARWLARNFEIDTAAVTLKGFTVGMQVIDTIGSYHAIYQRNPYTLNNDKAAGALTSAMGAAAVMQMCWITAQWITGAATPALTYAASLAGLSFPPTYFVIAGLAAGWGLGQALEPALDILCDATLAQLPLAPKISGEVATVGVAQAEVPKVNELFPATSLATTPSFSFAPPPVNGGKFDSPARIKMNQPIEFRTTRGNTEFGLTVNNPIGGIFFAGKLLAQGWKYFSANSRERSVMDLNNALIKLREADSESSQKKYLAA